MTTLLLSTFVIGGAHTLLWLPKALQMRRELKAERNGEKQEENGSAAKPAEGEGK